MILVMLLVGLLAPKLIPMPGFLSEGAPRKRRFALALLVTGLLLLPAVVGMLKGPQPIPIQAHAVGF